MAAPKKPLHLDELTAIQRRFQRIFVFMNLLTIALVSLVILRVTAPERPALWDNLRLCILAAASAALCIGQFYCLRRTNRESRDRIESLTFLDALTGTHNHRYLEMALESEVKRASRHCHPLCVAYLDLDKLKPVNDQFGHEVGNRVLSDVGCVLLVSARESDTVGRVGGDEFLVILPETDLSGAQIFAERIRSQIDEYVLQVSPDVQIDYLTCSVGVAEHPGGEITMGQLKSAADQAMYRAKRAGGNKVST